MAKDPATLWYWNDWIGGTITMTRQAKGAYMDLLTAQFNSGHLTETQIKTLLGQDQGLWATVLQEKFLVDGNGRYYNKRLDDEVEKRKNNSIKQRERVKKRWDNDAGGNTTVYTTVIPNIENENENSGKGGLGEKPKVWNIKPGIESLKIELPEIKIGGVIELFGISKGMKCTREQVISLWEIFKIQNFNGVKSYPDISDTYSHFFHWCKNQNVTNIQENIRSSAPKLTQREINDKKNTGVDSWKRRIEKRKP